MDVNKTLKPVFFISVIGGVCGFPAIFKKYHKYSCLFNILHVAITIINFIQLLVIPFGIIYIEKEFEKSLHIFHNGTHMELKSQHFVIKVLNPFLVSAVGFCSRLLTLFQQHKKVTALLTFLEEVDKLSEIPNKLFSHNTFSIKVFTATTLLISWPFQIFSYIRLISIRSVSLMQFIIFFLNYYNNFSATCCELQFISISFLIFTRFGLIQRNLRKIGKVVKRSSKPVKKGAKQCKLLLVEETDVVESKFGNLSANILNIKECQHALCEASDRLNKIYDIQLLISIASLFINGLLNLYLAIFGGFTHPVTNSLVKQNVSNVVNSTVWSVYYFSRFIFICAAADLLSYKANATKIFVCNIMRRQLDKYTKEELQNFLNYTTARNVNFTTCGFLTINLKLMTTAVVTGTTYMVILAQFHKS